MQFLKAAVVGVATSVLLALVLLSTAYARADERAPQPFDIRPQSLTAALKEFAHQSDEELLYAPEVVAKKGSAGVRGTMEPLAALRILLKDSGLTYSRTPNGAILVGAPGGVSYQSTGTGLNDSQKEGKKSSADRFRVAQVDQGQTSGAAAVGGQASNSQQGPEPVTLEEIVVTAQKRAERLQDVPEAVSALNGQMLHDMGAESFTDYARTIPGVTFTDAGTGRQTIAIRGLAASIGSSTVGYYIGETPIEGANPDLVDIDRIEVLRGPQGTLYGSESIGGTIKLIPNAPNLSKTEGEVQATGMVTQGAGGASPGGSGDIVLNVPIVDGIAAVRGLVWGRDVGGFIDRTYGYTGSFGTGPHPVGTVDNIPDEHTWGFRGTGLLQATDQFSVSAMIYLQNQHFNGLQDITGGATNPDDRLVQTLISNVADAQDNTFDLYSITANYNFGRFNLISSSGYSSNGTESDQEGTAVIQFALGGPPVPSALVGHNENYNFTEETRLATSERLYGFDAVLGVFYAKAHTTLRANWAPPQYNELVADNDPTNPLYAADNNLYSIGRGGYERQTAEFGEVTYHFTDALSATVGLRHFEISNGTNTWQDGLFGTGANTPVYTSVSAASQGTVHKGNISYKITPDHLVYAQYSEGFRPGFGNSPPPTGAHCNAPPAELQVEPDSIKNYEIGAKTAWLDKRLTVNAALYRINWTDIQQYVQLACGFGYIANFGEAVVKGAELEINDRLTTRVSAGLSGAYIRAQLQQGEPTIGALAGDQIEQVPNWQFALYGETTYPILQNDDGFARLDYQYTGSSWANYNRLAGGMRDPASEMQVLRLLNLKTGMHYSAWEFSLSGTNLLNQIARQSIDLANTPFAIPGRPLYVVNRPRTFFLNALYKF